MTEKVKNYIYFSSKHVKAQLKGQFFETALCLVSEMCNCNTYLGQQGRTKAFSQKSKPSQSQLMQLFNCKLNGCRNKHMLSSMTHSNMHLVNK